MARKPVSMASRLPHLEGLRKQIKPREEFNLGEMAKAIGMSGPSLRELIDKDPDCPIAERGREGRGWKIYGRKFVDHLIKRGKEEIEARREKAARIAHLGGADFSERDIERFGIDELLKVDRQQSTTQRRKIEQGHFVPLDQHNRVVAAILTVFQNGVRGIGPKVDKAGRLSPEIREHIDDELRNLLVECHDKLGEIAQNERRDGAG